MNVEQIHLPLHLPLSRTVVLL